MKKNLKHIIIVSSLLIFSFSKAQVDFKIRNLGVNVDGHFNSYNINADFDTKGDLIAVNASVNVKSIETGIEKRDKHILEDDYFDAEKHQKILLETIEVKKESTDRYKLKAKLTIKGKSKTVDIPISVLRKDNKAIIEAYFEINRKDYGVGGSSLVMSKTVKITVKHQHDL